MEIKVKIVQKQILGITLSHRREVWQSLIQKEFQVVLIYIIIPLRQLLLQRQLEQEQERQQLLIKKIKIILIII